MRKDFRFFTCPECGKKGVTFTMRRLAQDNFWCHYCLWEAFAYSNAPVDLKNLERLQQANPDRAL